MNDTEFNVFAYIRKQKDEENPNHKWYAVYAGVEYEGGDNVYADYDHSTEHLRISELADAIYHLANMYKEKQYLQELENMIA